MNKIMLVIVVFAVFTVPAAAQEVIPGSAAE